MKTTLLALVGGLLWALAGCSSAPTEDPATRLEGEWVIVDLNENNVPAPKDSKVTRRVTVKDQKFTQVMDGGTSLRNEGASSVRVNVGKEPAEIDLVLLEGPKAGKARLGLFAFDGERVKLCLGEVGGPRPEYLQAAPSVTMMVLERRP